MTVMINPFDAGGYGLADMTQAINILPNIYTRLGQLGLFRFEGVTQRSVLIEQSEGVLNLLPSVPLGGASTVANRDLRSMRSFSVPWIPHDDVITPQDIQGVRAGGIPDAADPLGTVMERKLTRMRAKHAQTREFMEVNALRGTVRDGSGATLYDYFGEFGLTRLSTDYALGTATTNVQAKVRDVLRKIETELKGESMTSVLALVSPEFFDKLIGHPKVEDAYKFYATGIQPLREDARRRFPFAGMVFEEYAGTVTLSTGATETLLPAGEGVAFPLGTLDTFVTYGAPANLLETVNTMGLPIYARQLARPDGGAIEVRTEASILPVNKRPRLAVRLFSGN
ncbi:MAG: major capsid protein [Alphaproteobacteria bacterium]|nr:MAG: major capsid protein [Alphaproteobacteria bacterium]